MTVNASQPKDFFWNHLSKDLTLIGKALNLNTDEVYIVIHSILFDVLNLSKAGTIEKWMQKDDRQKWENTFAEQCLQPCLRVNFNCVCLCNK